MENQREHGKKDVAEKTSKEITVNSLAELFADDEFGFEMFIMMKTGNPPIKHFTFYEGPTGRENDFKHKVQNSIVKSIRELYLDDEAEYAMAEQAGGNQNIFYIIKQDDDYKPFELLNIQEEQMGPFCMDDLRTLRDVENLIDLFDERYTVSLVTGAYDFDSLRKLVRGLQTENRKLRALLNKAAIPYPESEVFSDALSAAEYDLDQGARISQQYIGTNLATRFFSMFWAGKMYLQKELKMGITILNVIIVGTLPYAQSKKGKRDVNRLYIEEYKRNTCSKHELIADFSRSQENDLPFFGLFFQKHGTEVPVPKR